MRFLLRRIDNRMSFRAERSEAKNLQTGPITMRFLLCRNDNLQELQFTEMTIVCHSERKAVKRRIFKGN